jgi:hypothetical protein
MPNVNAMTDDLSFSLADKKKEEGGERGSGDAIAIC